MSERVRLDGDEVVLAWSGGSTAYRVVVGTTPTGSDVAVADVSATSYTFTAPPVTRECYARVASLTPSGPAEASPPVSFSTVDLHDVIDALFFREGPLTDNRNPKDPNAPAAVWPDGTRLRVEIARTLASNVDSRVHAALDDYASLVNGAVTATIEIVDDDFSELTFASELPPFTIAIRSLLTGCGGGGACANLGPAPLGPNASIVTLTSVGLAPAVAHELGHAYGLSHLRNLQSNIPELQFLMASPAAGEVLSDAEKAAITAARAGGVRAGTTRAQAAAAGLVHP